MAQRVERTEIGQRIVHYRLPGRGGRYRCGVGRRWGSQQITSTTNPATVTCRTCRRLSLVEEVS